MADPNTYEAVLAKDGGEQIKAMTPEDDKKLRVHINEFIQKMRDNLVAVRADGSGVATLRFSKGMPSICPLKTTMPTTMTTCRKCCAKW